MEGAVFEQVVLIIYDINILSVNLCYQLHLFIANLF